MPKISHAGASYAGHEGIVEDAVGDLHQVNPIAENAEVQDLPEDANVTPAGQDAQRAAERMRDEREQSDGSDSNDKRESNKREQDLSTLPRTTSPASAGGTKVATGSAKGPKAS